MRVIKLELLLVLLVGCFGSVEAQGLAVEGGRGRGVTVQEARGKGATVPVAQERKPMVRMAKIVVDSAQLEGYKAALKEGIEAAVRKEPGVLSLSAVYELGRPTHVTVLEVYADEAAYRAHLQTPHFKKYKETTKDMVKGLELVDVGVIGLEKKGN